MRTKGMIAPFALLAALLAGCGGGGGGTDAGGDGGAEDPTAAAFAPDHVLDVRVEIAPADWDALRQEGRGLATTMSGCGDGFEYTEFHAAVTIDGDRLEHVGVRKKGFLGSLSATRPSLKVDLDEFVGGQRWSGLAGLTLNNDRQDPSHAHQVLSYALFRAAGVAAPRCNLARVTVNGATLGVYSNVEGIGDRFLSRELGGGGGNLYEGQNADFTPELVDRFERKTNEDDPDRSDLEAVVAALAAEDSQLVASLEAVIDLDELFRFWAAEALVGHWDGYSGDRNNFQVYRSPADGLFHFVPWGTDGSFREGHSFLPEAPTSAYAWGAIAYRLYAYPQTRALYRDALAGLLDEVWDEAALLAEIDRIDQLVAPDAAALAELRAFVEGRRAAIEAEWTGDGPDWPYPFESEAPECVEPIAVGGDFAGAWGSTDDWVVGADLALNVDGAPLPCTQIANSMGPVPGGGFGEDAAQIGIYCARDADDPLLVVLHLPLALVAPGDVPLHGFETFGLVYEISLETEEASLQSYIGDGAISFAAAGIDPGDEIRGSVAALMTP